MWNDVEFTISSLDCWIIKWKPVYSMIVCEIDDINCKYFEFSLKYIWQELHKKHFPLRSLLESIEMELYELWE